MQCLKLNKQFISLSSIMAISRLLLDTIELKANKKIENVSKSLMALSTIFLE